MINFLFVNGDKMILYSMHNYGILIVKLRQIVELRRIKYGENNIHFRKNYERA